MSVKGFLPALLLWSTVNGATAAIIGTNTPAQPLTIERIATLPSDQQPVWKKYLRHSEKLQQRDHAFFFHELKKYKITTTTVPPHGGSARSIPLHNSASWYGGEEAGRIAHIVVSFQTPAGGWSKNLDMTEHERAPGEYFNSDNKSVHLTPGDNDTPGKAGWSYVGTFDNDATTTELRYLAKVMAACPPKKAALYRASFLRGMEYIFAAQYPNGGWPQVWPLEGGYHDAITYNDDAVLNIIEFLKEVADGSGDFAFVPERTRSIATAAVQRGIACFLATQIVVNGRRTVWCQQHDPLTLAPASARNYEMPSKCGSESSEIFRFLMRLPNPDAKIAAAVNDAAAWFEKTRIRDVVFKAGADGVRGLIPAPGGGSLWARYYEIGSDRPIFGDRDKTIHDDVREISEERRNGYSWFSGKPQRALDQYVTWSKAHPPEIQP